MIQNKKMGWNAEMQKKKEKMFPKMGKCSFLSVQ